jgi:predicted helicase
MTDIQHAHLYGMREAKYDWLSTHDVNSTDWNKIEPQKPFHLFIPQNNDLLGEFNKGQKITEIMPTNNVGFQTHRDYFVISPLKKELVERIKDFLDLRNSDDIVRQKYFGHIKADKYPAGDTYDWSLIKCRKELQGISSSIEDWITVCIRRPFDFQWYFHHPSAVDRGRESVTNQLIYHDNFGMLWTRPMSPNYEFSVLTASCAVDQSVVGNKTAGAGGTYVAPLYLYADIENPNQTTSREQRRPNFSDEFLTEITNKLDYTPTPEAIFYYIYAIFHSPTYRTRYAEFLKIDFPRVPLTTDNRLFRKLGEYGEELVALHLMKSSKLDQHLTQIIDKGGEFIVDAGHPKYTDGEVIINKKGDRFTGVPKSVWEFYVGGYQVCHKWLKDRKGRKLSPEDLNHYQKIIVALSETMQIMKAIDAAIPSFPIE